MDNAYKSETNKSGGPKLTDDFIKGLPDKLQEQLVTCTINPSVPDIDSMAPGNKVIVYGKLIEVKNTQGEGEVTTSTALVIDVGGKEGKGRVLKVFYPQKVELWDGLLKNVGQTLPLEGETLIAPATVRAEDTGDKYLDGSQDEPFLMIPSEQRVQGCL